MQQKIFRIMIGLVVLAFILSACAPSAAGTQPALPGTQGQGTSLPVPVTSGSIQMTGAGATFPFPLYSRWFYDYAFIDPSVKFNYQSIGSGGGIKQITDKTVDFGASDAILNDDQFKAAPGIQMFPTVAGAEAIVVNLKGKDGKALTEKIKFPYTAVADIYLGKIKKWNDPVLVNANPGIQLPDKDIIVVHRSDGSGTTYIFTGYLSSVSPEWKAKVGNGTSVQWPVGLGGKGNEGVYGTVIQNEGAIGYIELAYAVQNKAVLNLLQNKSQEYIEPSVVSTQAAMADFGSQLGDKLGLSIVDGPGKQSYPIAGYTYILMYMDQQDCAKAQKLIEFFKWAYSAAGDKDATELQYVALPQEIKDQVNTRLAKITCQGQLVSK